MAATRCGKAFTTAFHDARASPEADAVIETMGDDFDEQDHDWDSVHQDHPALINDVAFPDFHEELADLMPDFSDHGAANPMANSTSQGEIAICWGGLLAGNDASCTPGFVAGRGHFKNHVRETLLSHPAGPNIFANL